ncbi:MAG: GNAT family N-acetyltransferase [Methanomassiliicoccales archaeon]|jgi:RimJ/RimL family protein N-acetyltransferase|nr:GNAT family N-acetyltransferase [Methanomassiliicoccales archaeon]MDD1756476.1 GNAT family N-acetyltransferase [Methanomassiliicoccales archaeon]
MVEEERIRLRRGSEDDLDALAAMSLQRSQEQRQDEGVDIEQLKDRMRRHLRSDSVAFLFEVRGKVIGYSLVSRKSDPLNIIEYYLVREERGKGYGYEAVAKVLDATGSTSIDVSSNAWREAAGAM